MANEMSPMMRQYLDIKAQNPDSVLMFRVGDFYEMFFDDAKLVSSELDLVLTGKDCGTEERAPMCGVPYHSCEGYIARLIEKGHRVAICEQTEDPALAKGLVRREIVRVVTPGTVIEDSMLDEGRNNYLAAIAGDEETYGIAFADASTGELRATTVPRDRAALLDELARFSPSETLVPEGLLTEQDENALKLRIARCFTLLDAACFSAAETGERVCRHFGIETTDSIGLAPGSAAARAVGALLSYLYETQKTGLDRIAELICYESNQFMRLDVTAMRNLELCETMRGREKRGTLLWVLDRTKTAMGKRLLRKWIEQPLMSVTGITARLNAVDELTSSARLREELRDCFFGVHDIERLITRIVYGTAGARELRSLAATLERLPMLLSCLSGVSSGLLTRCRDQIDPLTDVYDRINDAIVEDPPFLVREGGLIKEGYNADLDSMRSDMTDGKSIITSMENAERERTGIKTLKVRYNKVFGYYIEVTNSFLDKVPDDYIRKQTLTGCERYITEELKNLEARVLGAKEHSAELEYRIFDEVRKDTAAALARIQKTAEAIAMLDVLASLAETASVRHYCRPAINAEGRIRITAGRHPVVEEITGAPFVPNDTLLDGGENRCAVITGPNMAGKSTYMRQVALIVILAQIGSFVPAESADIGICDAVFTRVGASDDLTTGQSTFMVEMNEVANILKNATKNSLLILDEIGRGTSTYDGMSIARAVVEHVADRKKLGAKTLFATHYHELTLLEGSVEGIKNYNIAVRKRGDDITFLRRIVRGGADDSYGIEVAKLSGIPDGVLKRAKQVLAQIESDNPQITLRPTAVTDQLPLETTGALELLNELKIIDANTLTPIEALTALSVLCDKAKKM